MARTGRLYFDWTDCPCERCFLFSFARTLIAAAYAVMAAEIMITSSSSITDDIGMLEGRAREEDYRIWKSQEPLSPRVFPLETLYDSQKCRKFAGITNHFIGRFKNVNLSNSWMRPLFDSVFRNSHGAKMKHFNF